MQNSQNNSIEEILNQGIRLLIEMADSYLASSKKIRHLRTLYKRDGEILVKKERFYIKYPRLEYDETGKRIVGTFQVGNLDVTLSSKEIDNDLYDTDVIIGGKKVVTIAGSDRNNFIHDLCDLLTMYRI